MHHALPQFVQQDMIDADRLVDQAVQGLLQRPATLSPKYFYDALGSRLFDAITALPEYYPTRTEASIFERHAQAIATTLTARCGRLHTMVDLGAGNCEKASALFAALRPQRYVAVDISVDYLRRVLARLQREHPDLPMMGVGTDFSTTFSLPSGWCEGPSLVFYPGSSIGNFTPGEALSFLRQVREVSGQGALLIGVDLAKPAATVEPAYDDALGITAAFNLNSLNHLNRLIGSDFELPQWKHVAFLDEAHSRIEMHLEARRHQVVQFQGHARTFEAGERIHTEYSYKWDRVAFQAMLHEAGYNDVQIWTDEAGWFAVMLAT